MHLRREAKEAVKVATKELSAAQSPSPQFSAETQRLTTAVRGRPVHLLEKKRATVTFASRHVHKRFYVGVRVKTACCMAVTDTVWT